MQGLSEVAVEEAVEEAVEVAVEEDEEDVEEEEEAGIAALTAVVHLSSEGHRLRVEEAPWDLDDATGGVVWPSARGCGQRLSRFLLSRNDGASSIGPRELPKVIVELGSGTGAASLSAAAELSQQQSVTFTERAEWLLTDRAALVPLLDSNVLRATRNFANGSQQLALKASELDWEEVSDRGSPSFELAERLCQSVDLLVGCELLYEPAVYVALAEAVNQLLGPSGVFFLATHTRADANEESFFEILEEQFGIVVVEQGEVELAPCGGCPADGACWCDEENADLGDDEGEVKRREVRRPVQFRFFQRQTARFTGKDDLSEEMISFFEIRTRQHIRCVETHMRVMEGYEGLTLQELEDRGRWHDASKFREPERTSYIFHSWWHRARQKEEPYDLPDEVRDILVPRAIAHHLRCNRHHKEFHASPDLMTTLDLVEMACDLTAISRELGSDTCLDWLAAQDATDDGHFSGFSLEARARLDAAIAALNSRLEDAGLGSAASTWLGSQS